MWTLEDTDFTTGTYLHYWPFFQPGIMPANVISSKLLLIMPDCRLFLPDY